MNLKITQRNFRQLLDDKNNAVVALSGKWGSGKSHLWNEFREQSRDEAIQNSVNVSLFGARGIADLKIKILQAIAAKSVKSPKIKASLTNALGAAGKVLKGFHKGFEALDQIALLAAPAMLKDRFITLDDIERKHSSLDIEEVLGFIEEAKLNYGSRFLLILNSDKLADDKGEWDKLREKVIDHELTLEITPLEAFDIAVQTVPSPYAQNIREAVGICGVTNIRIIYKIIRVVNRIFAGRQTVHDEVPKRIVPSTTLLASIHYGGIEDAPSLDFILSFNDQQFQMNEKFGLAPEGADALPENLRWRELLRTLGIIAVDEYEAFVAAHLASGLLDQDKLDAILNRYGTETDEQIATARIGAFAGDALWRQDVSDAALLDEAAMLAPMLMVVDPFTATGMIEIVEDLEGGKPLADELIIRWIREYNGRPINTDHEARQWSPWGVKLHAEFKNAYQKRHAESEIPLTLYEVGKIIYSGKDWGIREEEFLNESTPELFVYTIAGLTGEPLRLFTKHYFALHQRRADYTGNFAENMEKFIAACRIIIARDPTPRLSQILRRSLLSFEIG